jgi:hypothetical protein
MGVSSGADYICTITGEIAGVRRYWSVQHSQFRLNGSTHNTFPHVPGFRTDPLRILFPSAHPAATGAAFSPLSTKGKIINGMKENVVR